MDSCSGLYNSLQSLCLDIVPAPVIQSAKHELSVETCLCAVKYAAGCSRSIDVLIINCMLCCLIGPLYTIDWPLNCSLLLLLLSVGSEVMSAVPASVASDSTVTDVTWLAGARHLVPHRSHVCPSVQ